MLFTTLLQKINSIKESLLIKNRFNCIDLYKSLTKVFVGGSGSPSTNS